MSVEVTGWETVHAAMNAFVSHLEMAAGDTMDEIGEAVQRNIQESISDLYPPSSSRGEPPKYRTGALWAGIQLNSRLDGNGGAEAIITSTRRGGLGVPARLEYILDRPYMQPALVRAAQTFREDVRVRLRNKLGLI